jgi:tRNA pseudouridine38-40 synthase
MSVYRLDLAYDGTGFRGWARQSSGVRTVQGVLEEALARVVGQPVSLSVAGRTDAGVHAEGQVASFPGPPDLDLARLQRSLNSMLGPEVVVNRVRPAASGFDARHSATGREYLYRLDTAPIPDPFTARFVWHRPGRLDTRSMRGAAGHLLGEHDFASFCRAPRDGSSTVRRVRRVAVSVRGERVDLRVSANAFCHQMVRSVVGTLVAVGDGRMAAEAMPDVLRARSRSAARPPAPPHGLCLIRVQYGGAAPRPSLH